MVPLNVQTEDVVITETPLMIERGRWTDEREEGYGTAWCSLLSPTAPCRGKNTTSAVVTPCLYVATGNNHSRSDHGPPVYKAL